MIFDSSSNAALYYPLNERFERAFAFLAGSSLAEMQPGRYEIDGEDIHMTVMERELKTPDDATLEAHDRYIDIQLVIRGEETYGWRDRGNCTSPRGEMDNQNDILFYDDRPSTTMNLTAGQFVIFFPGDAHAPLIGEGFIKKCVVKIRL